jgi:DNA-binding MarR family transcriptional regulator
LVFDPLRQYPGYALRRASSMFMASLASKFSDLDLRISEATVLLVIQANPGIKQSTIGQILDIARANIAPLVGRLDTRGLIDRKPVDGRSHGLKLTPEGQKLADTVMAIVEKHERVLLERIPEDLRAPFMQALTHLWTPTE